MPAEANGALQTLICVLVVRSRWCLTLSNPVPWQNWMAAYLGYTLQMKTLFRGWPVMVHDTHTRRRRLKLGGTSQKNWLTFGGDVVLDHVSLPSPLRNRDLGALLGFLIQSPADFHDTQRYDWCQQSSESTKLWKQSGRHLDPNPDKSSDPNLSPGSLSVEVKWLEGGLCLFC